MSERRRQFYTDQIIQGYLLFALILLEVVLVTLLVYFLHSEISHLLENQIYQVHQKDHDTLPEIYRFLSYGLLGFLLVNIAALYAAHLIWGRYIKNTIQLFSFEMDKMKAFDFSPVLTANKTHHHMIQLMDDWMLKENQRKKNLNIILQKLNEISLTDSDEKQYLMAQKLLEDYRALLPQKDSV